MIGRRLFCTEDEWEAWLATRPEHVQRLARRFGPGHKLDTHKGPCFVIGYSQEADRDTAILLVSETDPFEDYEKAQETRQAICSCCGPSERKDNPDE